VFKRRYCEKEDQSFYEFDEQVNAHNHIFIEKHVLSDQENNFIDN